jgi:hypothetical protein
MDKSFEEVEKKNEDSYHGGAKRITRNLVAR